MNIAFVIGTPIHVITTINIVLNFFGENNQFHFFIYSNFTNSQDVSKRIKKLFPDAKVQIIDHSNYEKGRFLKLLFNYGFEITTSFDEIFIPSPMYFSKLLVGIAKKKNTALKLNIYEDGLASYLSYNHFDDQGLLDKILKKVNKYSLGNLKVNSGYFYRPDMLDHADYQLVRQIPSLTKDNIALAIIQQIFKVKIDRSSLENKVMILDQPFTEDGIHINDNEVLNKIIEISTKFNREIVIKLHPRSAGYKYRSERIAIIEDGLPAELYQLMYGDLKLLLVGVNSSALFTNQLLFGSNNNSVSVLKLIDKNQLTDTQRLQFKASRKFIEKFSNRFTKTRMINTYNDFEDFLRSEVD